MIYLIFKILRKQKTFWHKLNIRMKCIYYYFISKRRFVLKIPFVIGKRFSIISDISPTFILIKANLRARNNFNITIGNTGVLLIGDHCFFNNNCSINCLGNIEIGDNNQFGENVLFYDHNHQYKDANQLISNQGYTIGKILIGNNCWIGSNVIILKDVSIGDNCIIGAGCVIHQSIPSNSVVINKQNLLITTPKKIDN